MTSLLVRAGPAPNTDKRVPTDKETVKLERILFKQNVFDPKSKGADNVRTFFRAGADYDIELDTTTGLVRISSGTKHVLVHVSNAWDFREIGFAVAPVATPPTKFEAVKLAEGSFALRPVAPPPPPAPPAEEDEVPLPPRKRGRPRKEARLSAD